MKAIVSYTFLCIHCNAVRQILESQAYLNFLFGIKLILKCLTQRIKQSYFSFTTLVQKIS